MEQKTLGIILLTIIVKQILWIGFIPMWQFPDEQAHFGQVQNTAEGHPVNPARSNNTSKEIDDSEVLLGTKRDGFGNNKFTYHPEYNIPYSDNASGVYEQKIVSFPMSSRHEFVSNEATAYPQAYYLFTALWYKLAYFQDLITRVFVSRLANLCLFVFLVLVVFWTSKLIFPKKVILQLVLVVMVGFHPMLSFFAAGINSDNLFILIFSLSIYTCLRIIKQSWSKINILLMFIIYIIGINTKETAQLIPLLYAYPLLISLLKSNKKRFAVIIISSFLFILAFGSPLVELFKQKQFISELPNISLLWKQSQNISLWSHFKWTITHTIREVVPWYWGVFRWLSLTYPRIIHRPLNWLMVVSVFGLAIYAQREIARKKSTINKSIVGFLLYTSVLFFLAITVFDYLFTVSHGFSIGVQGRYFFPTIIPHMALLIIGFDQVTRKVNKGNLAWYLAWMMVFLHIYAFAFVISSYFDHSTWTKFFIQASQYKPWFFKTPILEIWCMVMVVFYIKLCIILIKTKNKYG